MIPSIKLIKETAPNLQPRGDDRQEVVADGGWRPVIAYVLTFQILIFFLIQFSAQLARGGQENGSLNLYAVYAYGIGPGELGFFDTTAVVAGIPIPFLSGWIMDRFGRRAVIVPGFSSYAVAAVLMSFTAFFPLPFEYFVFTYVLMQAAQGTTGGTMQVLGSDLSPANARGRFFAIWRMITHGGGAISPAVFAFVADHVGYWRGVHLPGGLCPARGLLRRPRPGRTMKRADQEGQAPTPPPRSSAPT